MHPEILKMYRRQPVHEIEYCPPNRANPMILTGTQVPVIWDLFDDDKLALVVLGQRETITEPVVVPVNPQQPLPTQSSKEPKRLDIHNFVFEWLETQYITKIRTNAGFYIDRAGRKIVEEEEPLSIYVNPAETAYTKHWNAGIHRRIEAALVKAGLRAEPMPVPENEMPEQPQPQPESTPQAAPAERPSADPALNPFANASVQPQPQSAPQGPTHVATQDAAQEPSHDVSSIVESAPAAPDVE